MYEYGGTSELVLIRRAKRGDAKAFSELYAKIYKDLYKFAYYMMKQQQDAEDAVGDAVVAAFENIGKLKKDDSFRSWMFKILANQCRRRLCGREYNEELSEELTAGLTTGEMDFARTQDVREAFLSLEAKDRLIVGWSVLGGYSSDEISEALGMNAATVRSRKSRALGRLRQMLA